LPNETYLLHWIDIPKVIGGERDSPQKHMFCFVVLVDINVVELKRESKSTSEKHPT
jgi:hypothetical protein